MPERVRRRWCPTCGTDVKAQHFGTVTGTHIAASCLTFGFWIPFWILLEATAVWKCAECGSRTRRSAPRVAIDAPREKPRSLTAGDRAKLKRDSAREKYLAERETWKGRDGR